MLRRAVSDRPAAGLLAAVVFSGAACLLTPVAAAADDTTPALVDSISQEIRRVFDERREAVVKVTARDGLGLRVGSGFFIDPAGTVFTHTGIVMKSDDVKVSYDGRELPAKVLVADVRSGVAILKVDANSPFIPFGNSTELTVASPLVVIGYAEDKEACPGFGIVAAFDREYLGQFFSTTHIRASLPVQRGQGGAPVMNIRGEAVGMVVARLDGGAGCHVLPIRAAEKVQMDLVRFGELRPGWVGAQVEEAPAPVMGSRARVETVEATTPAAAAGIQPGDVILRIGVTPVQGPEDVPDASFFLTAGDTADIVVARGNETLTFQVKPALHPLAESPRHDAAPEIAGFELK